ncbi:hypothetical protein MTP99_001005 [Tenebrio molitor]|nr:hypothetical protein MTP99_001005 [Tenebrio molitor]
MLKPLILINFCVTLSSASFIINYTATRMIALNETDSYFGYSVLLQKGNPPQVIVGAPRTRQGKQFAGSVYKCNLSTFSCGKYNGILRDRSVYAPNKNGDFLGSVLDGDNNTGGCFFTCAPRFISQFPPDNYFLNGRCFRVRDSTNLFENAQLILPLRSESQIGTYKIKSYYDAAFGESGFNLLYSKGLNELLSGAPGKSNWGGALVRTNLGNVKSNVFPSKPDLSYYHESYLGYAVAWGRFIRRSNAVWYISGAPRGDNLKGKVIFFGQDGTVRLTLSGEQFGSYFGSSLLVIHKSDGGDDVLVGAPMYSGTTFDEGCVYYYKNKNDGTLAQPIKLSNKKSLSRFGTVIADLGDIDLDSFPDCTISAPYEDDGVGAVYIYFGTKDGFSNGNVHRIAPSKFATVYPKIVVRGFGLGVSKGVDIYNKKHNDIVIGAYQSAQIFVMRSHEITDLDAALATDVNRLYTSTSNFSVKYCLKFSFRNGRFQKQSFFTSLLLVDSRVLNEQNKTQVVTIEPNKLICKIHEVKLKANHLNVDPFIIRYQYFPVDSVNRTEEKILEIPVTYECGTDNICHTNMTIKAVIVGREVLVVGRDRELKVEVTIQNSGEAAYQLKLYIDVAPEISLINLRECDLENGSYVCALGQIFNGTVKKSFLLDLANLRPNRTRLPVSFRVESIGQDVNPSDDKLTLYVPVTLQSNLHVSSQSVPDSVLLNKSETTTTMTHYFLVGNQGPSPYDLKVTIFVPQLEGNGSNILEIESLEGSVNGIVTQCRHSNKNPRGMVKLSQNNVNTTALSCSESEVNCTALACDGGYFSKSSENAIFVLKLVIRNEPLARFMEKKNQILIQSTILLKNGTKEFFTTASALIYRIPDNTIPLWILLVSFVSGIVLMSIVILVLYKCNFFKRAYKEKLENEQSDDEAVPNQVSLI